MSRLLKFFPIALCLMTSASFTLDAQYYDNSANWQGQYQAPTNWQGQYQQPTNWQGQYQQPTNWQGQYQEQANWPSDETEIDVVKGVAPAPKTQPKPAPTPPPPARPPGYTLPGRTLQNPRGWNFSAPKPPPNTAPGRLWNP